MKTLIALAMLITAIAVNAQAPQEALPLEPLFEFMNGQLPVKEGRYRKVVAWDGKIIEDTRIKFGYQPQLNDTWYLQFLTGQQLTVGASFDHFWFVGENTVQVTDRKFGFQSDFRGQGKNAPENLALGFQIYVAHAVTLGNLATFGDLAMGLGTIIRIDTNSYSAATREAAPIAIRVDSRTNGFPATVTAIFGKTNRQMSFTYSAHELRPEWLPTKVQFVHRRPKEGDLTNVWSWGSLELGEDKAASESGYVPSMFIADGTKLSPVIYTNSIGYNVNDDGKISQMIVPDEAPKSRVATLGFILFALLSLVGWLVSAKRRKAIRGDK